MLTRAICEQLQERRNKYIISRGWLETGNVWIYAPSFSVKAAWILIYTRRFLGTWVHHLLSLPAFRIKLPSLAPNSSLDIGLSCSKQYWLGLGHKCWWSQPEALVFRTSWPQLGNFWVRPQQLPGPLVLWIFPSKSPCSSTWQSGSWWVLHGKLLSWVTPKFCFLSVWVFSVPNKPIILP